MSLQWYRPTNEIQPSYSPFSKKKKKLRSKSFWKILDEIEHSQNYLDILFKGWCCHVGCVIPQPGQDLHFTDWLGSRLQAGNVERIEILRGYNQVVNTCEHSSKYLASTLHYTADTSPGPHQPAGGGQGEFSVSSLLIPLVLRVVSNYLVPGAAQCSVSLQLSGRLMVRLPRPGLISTWPGCHCSFRGFVFSRLFCPSFVLCKTL